MDRYEILFPQLTMLTKFSGKTDQRTVDWFPKFESESGSFGSVTGRFGTKSFRLTYFDHYSWSAYGSETYIKPD